MKTLRNLAQQAIDIQNAVNPLGLTKSFADALSELRGHCNGTGELCAHPIYRLWALKLLDLSGIHPPVGTEFGEAYQACVAMAARPNYDAVLAEAAVAGWDAQTVQYDGTDFVTVTKTEAARRCDHSDMRPDGECGPCGVTMAILARHAARHLICQAAAKTITENNFSLDAAALYDEFSPALPPHTNAEELQDELQDRRESGDAETGNPHCDRDYSGLSLTRQIRDDSRHDGDRR